MKRLKHGADLSHHALASGEVEEESVRCPPVVGSYSFTTVDCHEKITVFLAEYQFTIGGVRETTGQGFFTAPLVPANLLAMIVMLSHFFS